MKVPTSSLERPFAHKSDRRNSFKASSIRSPLAAFSNRRKILPPSLRRRNFPPSAFAMAGTSRSDNYDFERPLPVIAAEGLNFEDNPVPNSHTGVNGRLTLATGCRLVDEDGKKKATEREIAIRTFKYFWKQRTPCLLYTSPSPRDLSTSRMPSSA